MDIMKLGHRIAILFFVCNLFLIIYLFIVPDQFNDLYSWYKHAHRKNSVKSEDDEEHIQHVRKKTLKKIKKINLEVENDWKGFIRKNDEGIRKKFILPVKKEVRKKKLQSEQGLYKDENEVKIAEKLTNIQKTKVNKVTTSGEYSKLILIFTYLHKEKYWYNLPLNETKDYLKRKKCKVTNCGVTYDKGLFSQADVVIFHERNLPSTDLLQTMNRRRPKDQRWVFFTSETPLNSESGIIPYNGFFNWTMTYKVSSDIFLPYLQYRELKKKDLAKLPRKEINYAANKKFSIAWLVSNCHFGFRMEFAHLLDTYTEIHVGGNCRDDFKNHINCTRYCELDALKDYKFFLSFENGVCTDYVSEKYWKYLELGLVPVVLGGANYSDPKIAIPGSYIDASNFNSVKDLAVYLDFLNKNDKEYNKYFDWKKKYKIWHPIEGDWPFESYFLCKICKLLSKGNLANKVYVRLSDYWNSYEDCELPEMKLKKKFVPPNYSWESSLKREDEKRRLEKSHINKDFDEVDLTDDSFS